MKSSSRISGLARRAVVVVVTSALVGSVALTAASATTTPAKKKPLSLTNVTIANATTPVNGPTFIGLSLGIFKKYGLNVNWLSTASSGALAGTAILIAGGAQFAVDGVTTQVAAVENGAPIRALAMEGVSGAQQIAISQSFATAHNIPSKNATTADAAAQFKALKGSHMDIAVSSITSNAYYWFVGAARHYGLTIGTSKSTGDVYFSSVGSPANEDVAFESGKVDALINVPPVTTVPDSIIIPFYRLNPLTTVVANYLSTTIPMIQQHPDTVQAMTTAFEASVEAAFSKNKKTSTAAENAVTQELFNSGTTDPSQEQSLYVLNKQFWKNPFPSRSIFDQSIAMYDLTLATPFTVPYKTFVATRFAVAAAKALNLPTPA